MRARPRFSLAPASLFISTALLLAIFAVARRASADEPALSMLPPVPPGYYPPPPPTGVYRAFSLTIAAGPGALWGPGESDFAVSYNLFRVGLGVARNVAVIAGFEGVGASSFNPDQHVDSWLKQEVWFVGAQYFLLPQLHVRASVGRGTVAEVTATRTYSGGAGVALSAGVGYELVQLAGTALGLELYANTTRYPTESWEMAGLNLALSFF